MDKFVIIDLISQRNAVRDYLGSLSKKKTITWLMEHGYVLKREILGQEVFYFESFLGLQARFFFNGDEIVFLGDHTAFR